MSQTPDDGPLTGDTQTPPENAMLRQGLSRHAWQALGFASVGIGTIGIFVPLLPTVGFYVFAAYCFTRSNPVWEAKMFNHPQFGPHIRAWRERGAIHRRGKIAATLAFAFSIVVGALTLAMPMVLAPPIVAVIMLSWLWTRPEWRDPSQSPADLLPRDKDGDGGRSHMPQGKVERPTTDWRGYREAQEAEIAAGTLERADAFALDLFPEAFTGPTDSLMDQYEATIAALPTDAGGYGRVMAAIETIVVALNDLNEEGDGGWIETDERERLCAYIEAVITARGIDIAALAQSQGLGIHELTDNWREW